VLPDRVLEIRLREDRDPVWVERTGERRGIYPPVDVRDLGGRECEDVALLAFTEEDVEVVEVPAGRTGAKDAPLHPV
jgi:hypothetical protein